MLWTETLLIGYQIRTEKGESNYLFIPHFIALILHVPSCGQKNDVLKLWAVMLN